MSSNVIRKKQLILLGGAVTLSVLYFVHATRYFLQDYMETKKLSCKEVLESLQPPFKALLIDVPFLLDYQGNNCTLPNLLDRPLRLAVLNNLTHETDEKYTVIRYEEEAPGRDYWLFHDNATRAIYKLKTFNLGNFVIPSDASLFSEYWKRSSLLKCLNLDMKRTGNTSYLPPQASVTALSELSNLLVSFGMYPFLNGGTLLGYYRECGLIPHTSDMDLAVFVEQYNPDFLTLLEGNKSSFRIKRRLGTVKDGYEFTVFPRRYSRPAIDIFFMYNNGLNESWVGGTGGNGQKYQYIYPLYNPWCSADLLGRLFWITCTPEEMLEFEYGPNWKRDHLTKRYSWNKSGHNVRKGSKWTESELKKVYVTY